MKVWVRRVTAWARDIKRDSVALWLAVRDTRVPWHAKALAAIVTAYALSPIDLIPDFIPILGYLDDLLIVPLGILAAVRLIPMDVMADLRAKAAHERKPTSTAGLVVVIMIWLAAVAFTVQMLWPLR